MLPIAITANYDQGILTVRMPQRDTGMSKEIPVARGEKG